MNIPLRRGRGLDGSQGDAQSIVISETMARAFWPSGDPVGQPVSIGAEGRRLALFLSIVGLTGTVSYSVGQRVREFGIRAALGAAPADQARLVCVGALHMAGPGIAIGLFGALLLSWLIASGVSGLDLDSPMMYAMVGLLQLTMAMAAAAIPGRRAARANPLAALRAE